MRGKMYFYLLEMYFFISEAWNNKILSKMCMLRRTVK